VTQADAVRSVAPPRGALDRARKSFINDDAAGAELENRVAAALLSFS
jgi:hypothetical protein